MQRFIIRFSIMVQAIFFDIDGTLVSFRTHEIPQSTRKALKELRSKGIKLFIATGRPETLMREAIGDLEFDGFIILNGGTALRPTTGSYTRHRFRPMTSNV